MEKELLNFTQIASISQGIQTDIELRLKWRARVGGGEQRRRKKNTLRRPEHVEILSCKVDPKFFQAG